MKFFREIVLKNSVEIKTSPEKIWAFWENMEKNYKAWHPEDHILWRWTRGKPLEEDSTIYAEEFMHGKLHKIKGVCVEVDINKKFVFKPYFPLSIVWPKSEYIIEPKGPKTVFTSIDYFRFGRLGYKYTRSKQEASFKATEKHIREEGEYFKKILEMDDR